MPLSLNVQSSRLILVFKNGPPEAVKINITQIFALSILPSLILYNLSQYFKF